MPLLQISLEELESWKQEVGKDFILVDVREPNEHHEFNIGGILVPLSELSKHTKVFEQDLPVVFYCQRGIRSQIAIQRLMGRFPHGKFYNLTNGIKRGR
jgi:adenylyltransferase/sulfurtransferase